MSTSLRAYCVMFQENEQLRAQLTSANTELDTVRRRCDDQRVQLDKFASDLEQGWRIRDDALTMLRRSKHACRA